MPTAQPTFVAEGDPVLASDLDSILAAADERLGVLYHRQRSWLAFDRSALPAHQVPPWGCVYILTEDAKRSLIPAETTLDESGLFYWPGRYQEGGYQAQAVADFTIDDLDAAGVAWEVTGTWSGYNGYSWGDCATVIQWEHESVTRPIRLAGDFEPERFHRYAVADVLMEDDDLDAVTWLGNKHGVLRLHNLGRQVVTVTLDDDTKVDVPVRGVVVLRRRSFGAAWESDDRHYFPQAVPGDIPMWDCAQSGWANQTLRSQSANPIFRQALIASMFRPTALSLRDPGLVASSVIGVGVQPATDDLLAELVCDHGDVEVVRTCTSDEVLTDRFVIPYDGIMDPAATEWADCGLAVSLDDDERAAVVEPDGAFPPPDSGSWHYDIISRSSNLTGGIVVAVRNATVTQRVLRPWWTSPEDADEWFATLFHWPDHSTEAEMEVQVYVTQATWDPDLWTPPFPGDPNPDEDYFGGWSTSGTIEYRSYKGFFGSTAAMSVAPWNLWSTTIAEALPDRSGLDAVEVKKGIVCTALVLSEEAVFWHTGATSPWDTRCPISPAEESASGIDYEIHHDGQALGLGQPDETDTWWEPRWRTVLLPTIGWDPQTSWEAIGWDTSEPIVWTPLHRQETGAGTICHFRTLGAEGRAAAADWYWSYSIGTTRDLTYPGAPSAITSSGMTFWRCFRAATTQPGEADPYPGQPLCGPHPWPVRDHGWLADRVLEGADPLGQTWFQARGELYDEIRIGGPDGGDLRPIEYHVGMQLRMGWRMHNHLASLVQGVDYCRPLTWEHYVDGFRWEELVTAGGWDTGSAGTGDRAVAQATAEMKLQPFGAVHFYGLDSAIDATLDALGITRRTSECPELQGLATVDCKEWVDGGSSGYILSTFTRPSSWSGMGGEIEWCSVQDLEDALDAIGWECDIAWLVQPVSLETLVPDASMESVVDTSADFASNLGTHFHARPRLPRTVIAWVPDTGADPVYQIRSASQPWRSRLALPRPTRSQVMSRRSGTFPTYGTDIIKVVPGGDEVVDSLDRGLGEYAVDALGVTPDPTACWNLVLLAGATLAATYHVACVPVRRLLWDFSSDETGPRAGLGWGSPYGVECLLPSVVPRVRWLPLSGGGTLSAGDLCGGTPTWPDDYHTWDILLDRRRGLVAF